MIRDLIAGLTRHLIADMIRDLIPN
jgi:hypothetical protein